MQRRTFTQTSEQDRKCSFEVEQWMNRQAKLAGIEFGTAPPVMHPDNPTPFLDKLKIEFMQVFDWRTWYRMMH